MAGIVVWITGLPGAGKTSLAADLITCLKADHIFPVWLDGDSLRQAIGEFSVEHDARLRLAYSYARLASMLAEQGHLVICSTVSLFHEVQLYNRAHLPGYIEVFIDTHLDVLAQRNQKGLYKDVSQLGLAGIFEYPPQLPTDPEFRLTGVGNEDTTPLLDAIRIAYGSVSNVAAR